MIIYKEDLQGTRDFTLEDTFDFSKIKVEDALIDKINKVNFSLDVNFFNEEDFVIDIQMNALVDYFDAKTLDKTVLKLDVEEEVPFSFNKDTANELDIDFFEDELNLKDLIFELVLLNIPFNYSENENEQVLTEQQFDQGDQNKPFAQIFNNKGEE